MLGCKDVVENAYVAHSKANERLNALVGRDFEHAAHALPRAQKGPRIRDLSYALLRACANTRSGTTTANFARGPDPSIID